MYTQRCKCSHARAVTHMHVYKRTWYMCKLKEYVKKIHLKIVNIDGFGINGRLHIYKKAHKKIVV